MELVHSIRSQVPFAIDATRLRGILQCHTRPYLTSFVTTVVSCEAMQSGYAVSLADTILFPEGGGQPSDTGSINGALVTGVARDTHFSIPKHFMESPMTVGESVTIQLDWERRFDHMQQHTGQHLISALARRNGFETNSWRLAPADECFVELTGELSEEDVENLEKEVNQVIRSAIDIQVAMVTDYSGWETFGMTKGSGHDFAEGAMRVVSIGDLDHNPCCGTHLANTAELQMVKFFGTQSSKGFTKLMFVAGNRCTVMLERLYGHSGVLTRLLGAGPIDHAKLVEKAKSDFRSSKKTNDVLLKELAVVHAESVRIRLDSGETLVHFHHDFADLSFLRLVCGKYSGDKGVLFLTGDGVFMLIGPSETLKPLVPKVCEALNGKGGGKGKVQGKFAVDSKTVTRIQAAKSLLLESLN